MTHAFKGALGVGVQTTGDLSAALVARTRFARYIDLDFDGDYDVEDDPTSGRSEMEDFAADRFNLVVKGTLEGTVEGPITMLIKSLMGVDTITTPGGGAISRDHTLSIGDTLVAANRLSVENKYGTRADAEATNIIVKKIRYDFTQKGAVRWSFEALGGKPEYIASATAVTLPSKVTQLARPMHTLTLFGLADNVIRTRSGFWELERVLDEDDFRVNSLFRQDASYGAFKATWGVEAEFDNADQRRRAWGAAANTSPADALSYYAAVIKAEHPTLIEGALKYTAKLDAPRCRISVAKPQRAKDKIIQSIRGAAVYDTATTKAAEVLVRNTQPT